MKLRALHRSTVVVVAVFVLLHLANHLAALGGVAKHMAFMDAARTIYRQPVVEVLLLLCVAVQVCSGLWLLLQGWRRRRGAVAWLQALSGAAVAGFLLIHVSAVLYARTILDLDTTFYFGAAGFHVPPFLFFFAPYYFIAIVALFTHVGCAAYRRLSSVSPRVRVLTIALPVVVGAALSLVIVLILAGAIVPVEVPAKYKATYAGMVG
ncbi:hypothetical protein QTI66_10640 [Variovorax sp. J22R133]|uniref:hypothetical protein n=1 Tax=Variovorax brevis TaxID=3053503 RepID=UPI00257897C0|nr:hypothetical protein [Variovorax sp. J22R133]MDM0112606.1 hypothetical protein [Variovorax sp. J22R133]